MKRTLTQVVCALFFALSLSAQTDKCYTDQLVNKRSQTDPVYAQQMDAWRNQIVQIAQQNQVGEQRGALYTIPIVFHVILSSQAQVNSITNTIIQNQLNTLNRDFRRQNSDTTTVRTTFKPLISDVEIEFCLAQRDPSGNSATGITRTVTSHGAWDPNTEGDDMKFTASGGMNAWQPTKYINVWVVDIAGSQFGGTAGYAYLGGTGIEGNAVDGIVLDFQLGFGSTNRSLTHEMGHYFGLYHTWGTANSCSNDDGISDTPESFSANFGCDYSENSCTSGSPDLPDQIENYMDYSDCPAMFTTQQKSVMRSVLTGSRSSLINSNNGCTALNSPPVANFSASATSGCPGSTITFTDASTNGATSWSWSFPGGSPSTSTAQNPTISYAAAGTYNVVLTATNSFGSDVETKTGYITIGTGVTATIFSENFEGTITGWGTVNPDNGATWQIVGGVGGSVPGDRAAYVNLYDYQPRSGQRDGLVSPAINLTGKTNISLTFNYGHRRYDASYKDSLLVYVSTNGGASFTKVYGNAEDDAPGASFATGTITTSPFIPTATADWCTASATGVTCPVINLNAYSGQANFRIKFETYNDNGNNIFIDNIVLTGVCSGTVTQPPVANFTANTTSGCNAVTVNFTDQSTNTPTSWAWTFTGGNPSSSTVRNPTVTYSTPGTYSVTLTATNGDGSDGETKSNYITVYAPAVGTSTFVNASCPGVNNGSINLSVTGNGPYTYIWSNGPTTQDISNLAAGTYTVTITDANTCTSTRSTTVGTGNGPSTSVVKVDASCTGVANGSINLSVSNGSTPYSYAWSNGTTTQDLNAVTSGTYTVTVTDGNSCTASNSTTINAGNSPVATASTFDASCSGVSNGLVDVSVTGGTAPYDYEWSTGATTQDLNNIASGTYTVTVTDANGCTTGQTGVVGKGNSLELSASVYNDSLNTGTGSILVSVTDGTAPFGYAWNTGSTSVAITGLNAGSYSVTVTDANGCQASGTYVVGNDTATAIFVPSMDLTYSVYPNPTSNVLNVQVSMAKPCTVRMAIYNAIGQKVLEQSYVNTDEINAMLNVSTLENGVYFLRMESENKAAVSRVVVMKN